MKVILLIFWIIFIFINAINQIGHFLLRSFDVISWLPMPEEEFNLVEAAFKAGKYQVKIEDCQISPLEILELERSTGLEVKNNIALQRKNMARLAEE